MMNRKIVLTYFHLLKKGPCIVKKKNATLDNNKGFINLRFLQKVNCKKTVWDQARLSSLV